MHLRFHDDVAEFADTAAPVYQRDPALHTVELSLLRGGPLPGNGPPLMITAWDGAELVGAAMATTPFPLLCSGLPAAAIPAAVADLSMRNIRLSGVRGLRATALTFAGAWSAATGCTFDVDIEERLYRLGTLNVPTQVRGAPRSATRADTDLLIDWQCAFAEEVFGHPPDRSRAGAALQAAAASGDAHLLWTVDAEPVTFAAVRSPAAGVSRIGPVFTPVAHRGHGYGSVVTAVACQWAARAGATDVVLFTDLANPTSNAIYQEIGFWPAADTMHISFTAN